MPLDLPHDGQRHMRAFRKLTLTPAKLTDTIVDDLGNRRPIFRLAFQRLFLCAPLPAPRLAEHRPVPHPAPHRTRRHYPAHDAYQS